MLTPKPTFPSFQVKYRDKDGKEYACYLDALKGNIKHKDELTEEEKANCMDVNQLIGTERW